MKWWMACRGERLSGWEYRHLPGGPKQGSGEGGGFQSGNISKARVNFRPGPVLADAMKTLNFSKVSTRAAAERRWRGDGDIVDDPTA